MKSKVRQFGDNSDGTARDFPGKRPQNCHQLKRDMGEKTTSYFRL